MNKIFICILSLALLSCSPRYQLESVNQFYETKNKLESTEGFKCNINSKISLDSAMYIETARSSNQGNDRIRMDLINNNSTSPIADIDTNGVFLNPRALKKFQQSEINLIISNSFDLLKQNCQKDHVLYIKNLGVIRSYISKLKKM